MLNINSIRKGIVIDHIKPGYGFKIFQILKLDSADFTVALIMNAKSKKHECKDMIKIENVIDLDLAMLGFMDPNITINIINNEKIKEKINLSLPKKIEGIIECNNPRCITSEEREITHKFELIDEDNREYKCSYCDNIYSWEG